MSFISAKRLSRWTVFLGFFLLIFCGGLMLNIPFMHDGSLRYVDAFFISTSAACVTGLATVPMDTFTIFGHIVIILLIQFGGLGVMTFTSAVILLLRKEMSFKERIISAGSAGSLTLKDFQGLIKAIFVYTGIVEFIGFILLLGNFLYAGQGIVESVYNALFHAISAFCNAGFSTFDDNLMSVSPFAKVVISFLIIFGGIGFYVVYDIRNKIGTHRKLRLNTKLILVCTAILLVVGGFGVYILEGGKIGGIDAFFQSVTCRTAGFNSVTLTNLHVPTIFFMIILMIIGAAPGSTGGGLKTNVISIVILAIHSFFRGRKETIVWGRKIADSSIRQCFIFISLYLFVFIIVGFTLMIWDSVDMQRALFESASALGTVGLTLDLTPTLSDPSKWLLMMAMFLGRLGPAFCVIFFAVNQKESLVQHVEEEVILG